MEPGTELSFAEKLMWQADLGGPEALPFFDCARSLWLILRLQGPLDQKALESSFNTVVQRHAVLLSRFVQRNGQPVRLTSMTESFRFTAIERPRDPLEDAHEIVKSEIKPRLERQFNLADGPLFRAMLMVLGSQEHILAVAVHHIVFDRWSKRLLESELQRSYSACVSGRTPDRKPLSVQYQDYVLWQREQLQTERACKLNHYWTNKLAGLPGLRLPCDGANGRAISTRSGSSWFTVPAEEVSRLVALSRQSRTTLAATMLAIFTLFLHQLSDMDDIAVGVPLSDRRRPEFEEVIGLFMNVVVVRTSIPDRITFQELLDRVRRSLVDACLHQDMPYGHLQQIIPARRPYRAVFNFMPRLPAAGPDFAGLQAHPLSIPAELRSLADLSLHVRYEAETLLCRVVYKADLFSEDHGWTFATQMRNLTKAVLQAPQNCLGDYFQKPIDLAEAARQSQESATDGTSFLSRRRL